MGTLTDREAAAERAVEIAVQLAYAVRYEGPSEVARHVGDARASCGLEALVVMLAAMVPDDRSPAELLRWFHAREAALGCDPRLDQSGPRAKSLHGTRSRAEAGCGGAACQAARTAYYAERHRDRRGGGDRREDEQEQVA